MADIRIVCSECGQENVFSEYSRPEARRCRKCDTLLGEGASSVKTKLRVRKRDPETDAVPYLQENKPDPKEEKRESPAAPKKKKSSKTRLKSPSSFLLGLLAFIVFGGLLVALQYYGRDDRKILEIYRTVRLFALGLGYLIVLIDAFMESQVSGFLALLFPPYLIYYALVRLDSFWRQGLFMAVVLMLAAEMYFMKDDAIITHSNRFVQKKIDYVSEQLDKAGKSSVPAL